MIKTVLSARKVKSRAALKEMTLQQINDAAGFGPGYIYRLWGSEDILVSTVNRIAQALDCGVCDLLEEVEVEAA